MRILNPQSLPESLVRAVTPPEREIDFSRMSVTDLIGPPQIRQLKLTNWSRMEERVEDRVWLMLGSAFHDLMHKHAPGHSEVKIEIPMEPYTLVGVPDVYEDGILYEFKTTSTWSFIYGIKDEWINQLQVYLWLLAQKDVHLNGMKIIAILRDWMESKSFEPDYPDYALKVVDIPMWPLEKTEQYIRERIQSHIDCLPCTDEDKWAKPTTFAVKLPDRKTALRVLDSKEEAEKWLEKNPQKGKPFIETRPGEYSRCRKYCSVSAFCDQNIYRESNGEIC